MIKVISLSCLAVGFSLLLAAPASAQRYVTPNCPRGADLVSVQGRLLCEHRPRTYVHRRPAHVTRDIYREDRYPVVEGHRPPPAVRNPPIEEVYRPPAQVITSRVIEPAVAPRSRGLAPNATVGANCGQKDCVIVPFQHYIVKGEYGIGNFKDCVPVPNQGDAKVVRCKDENGWFARFAHDLQGRLRDVKHEG